MEVPQVATPVPGPRSQALLHRAGETLTHGMSKRYWPIVVAGRRGDGFLVEDADGNTYADHLCAWGSSPFGATPPTVRTAMLEAWDRFGMEVSVSLLHTPALELAERLRAIAPAPLTRTELSVTGSLAVEAAVKHARAATGRPLVLCFGGQYHGESTYLTATASTDTGHVSTGSSMYSPGIVTVPFPMEYRSPFDPSGAPRSDTEVLDHLEHWVLAYQVDPEQIACVLIEPVLVEAGVHTPSAAFWTRLRAMCDRWGWLLAVDEVQTCMGRCGTMFAIERWGVRADLVVLAKGFAAGGQPIAAVLGTDAVLGRSPLVLGSTFGWQPAAAAGALAGIDLLLDTPVLDHVHRLAACAEDLLRPLLQRFEHLGDVRVNGALAAVEFVSDRDRRTPAPAFALAYHRELMRRGVLGIGQADKWYHRLQPALTMPIELFRWSLERVAESIEAVEHDPPVERADLLESLYRGAE